MKLGASELKKLFEICQQCVTCKRVAGKVDGSAIFVNEVSSVELKADPNVEFLFCIKQENSVHSCRSILNSLKGC